MKVIVVETRNFRQFDDFGDREALQIARWRVQAGLVSSLDVEQAQTERAQNAAAIPAIEQNFASAAYRIAVLTGRAPGDLLPLLRSAKPIPVGPANIATGVPADTLRQRPDVRSAERALAAATARIGVAQAQLRPNLVISGNIGTSALSIGGLFDGIVGNLLAGMTLVMKFYVEDRLGDRSSGPTATS